MHKMGWFGAVRGHSMSWTMPPFDRGHTTSYSTLIETMCLSFAVFTARCYASAVLHVAMGLCLSVSVCLSVTSRCSTKTAKRRITQTTPHDSPGTLVFWYQRSTRNSTGSPSARAPNAGAVGQNRRLLTNNRLYSKTVQDRHTVSIKVE